METELKTTVCSKNDSRSVEVLFVGSRPMAPEMAEQLNENGLTWESISIRRLEEYLQQHTIRGTVIVDGEFIPSDGIEAFQTLLEKLDQKHIAVICFNCPPSLRLDHLQLAAHAATVEFDELWARIESNVRFSRRLQSVLNESPAGGAANPLGGDTAQQLEMAARVQRNFLPSRLPDTDRISWAAVFRPAEWVSGDIYDIARLDEEHIGFYLADAVGHSVPAALLTMFLKQATVMRQTIGDRYFIYKPADVIKNLNLRMAEQELNGCLFATCVYGLLNIRTLQLEYARAGHPYPVLIRDNQLISLQTRGGLLGVFDTAEFEQHSIQLQTGDKLFMYSDGGEPLIGQSNEDGTLHFSKSFEKICRLPIDQMLKTYSQMAADFHFAPGQIDDVTAIGLEIL
jgi:sigma-B regulation protein RsbU (phosphoserine phosphatase)